MGVDDLVKQVSVLGKVRSKAMSRSLVATHQATCGATRRETRMPDRIKFGRTNLCTVSLTILRTDCSSSDASTPTHRAR
jgi:hypothetical protein